MTALKKMSVTATAAGAALLALGASAAQAAAPAANPASVIASAETAAPPGISSHATIVTSGSDGSMTVLRKGTNGWTCSAETPGPGPMCYDAGAAKWVDARMHKTAPPADAVGIIYMLEGGMGGKASAGQPGNSDGGPHLMIVGSKELLAAYPAEGSQGTSTPFVMGAGTPYAHLMVPVGH